MKHAVAPSLGALQKHPVFEGFTKLHPVSTPSQLVPRTSRTLQVQPIAYEVKKFELKGECRVSVFKSVCDRDVADAAYRDVFTAVLETDTRRFAATEPKTELGVPRA